MIILPAVDIIDGSAVRLYQGDYGKKKVYDPDPSAVACRFRDAGAKHIHIVDLDGALHGESRNFSVIRRMISASGLKAEVGGGIRTMETIKRYFDEGVERVILGTAAVNDPKLLEQAVASYGDGIAVGADIRDGVIAIKGWVELSRETPLAFAGRMEEMGVRTLICTDVSKDGALSGTNHALYAELTKACRCNLIASGGITSLDELRRLKENGLWGAICGKAIYDGKIDLREAISEVEG